MVKGKISLLVIVTVVSVLLIAGCYRTPEQRAEHMVKRIAATLKLDDAQTAKLEKIKDEFLAKRPDMMKLREETVNEANALMRSAQLDQARLNALVEKNRTQADEFVRFIFAKFTEIHDMLTPEQRDKLAAEVEEHLKYGHRK
jgi:Spy/CpxP family protein refolding chaperone